MSNQTKAKKHLTALCFSAVMAALYVGLDLLATLFSSVLGGGIKVSLSGLPVILTSIIFGPLWGAATGFLGAFIGQMLSYGFTPTTLLWVLPAFIRGLSFGLLYIAFKRKNTFPYLCIITVITSLLVTAINTVVMWLDSVIYNYYSFAYVFGGLAVRIVSGVATAVVFALVLPPIVKAVIKIVKIR